MKRTLILVVTLALLLGACATTTAPGAVGTVTEVNGKTVSVALSGGDSITYNITNRTAVYSPEGTQSLNSYLSKGQKVMVWAEGSNAVRINIGS